MKLPDGREALIRFELPLPITLWSEIARAVDGAVSALGYTDVVITDGGKVVVATPPGVVLEQPHSGPPAAEGGAPAAH